MSIEPIRRSIVVPLSPERSFALFTGRMGEWWPRGKTPGGQHVDVVVEPHAGGGWFERDAAGTVTKWGKILVWEPPARLIIGWQLNSDCRYDPEFLNEVEITFTSEARGGTLVRLEHRGLEKFGVSGRLRADNIDSGWTERLSDFTAFVAQDARQEA